MLVGAVGLIESDYMLEVDATVNYVRAQMKSRKFWERRRRASPEAGRRSLTRPAAPVI